MCRFVFVLCLIASVLMTGASVAEIPRLINYQGMLTDNSGSPLTDTVDIVFIIYDDPGPTAGNIKWEETQYGVPVINGLFNVILGSANPINLAFDQDYWLDIWVEGEQMPERLRFTSVGYAYRAQRSDTASYAFSSPSGPGDYTWTFRVTDGNDSTIATGGGWGIARFGNTLYGNADSTHVNLGVACTTGIGEADMKYCTVAGGLNNAAGVSGATVGGGSENRAWGGLSTVAGGTLNTASGGRAVVGGGWQNTASEWDAAVGGGEGNCASQTWSTVGGGLYDTASGVFATIPGGNVNKASGDCSFAAGNFAKAIHHGSFVWADFNMTDFYSQGDNTFNIRATGGVYCISNSFAYGARFENSGSGDGIRAYAHTSNGYNYGAVYAINYGTSPAIYADASGDTAAYFNGSVVVTGTVYKSALASVIDHPLDPENKYLCHSGVESPDMMNIYNGNVELDANGEAWVELPGWFESLNRDFRYQLTCIGAFAPVYIAQKISSSRFKIAGGKPGIEVSWQVTGIRRDPYAEEHRLPVETDKPAGERGKYLHPDAYGAPETMGINHIGKESEK